MSVNEQSVMCAVLLTLNLNCTMLQADFYKHNILSSLPAEVGMTVLFFSVQHFCSTWDLLLLIEAAILITTRPITEVAQWTDL